MPAPELPRALTLTPPPGTLAALLACMPPPPKWTPPPMNIWEKISSTNISAKPPPKKPSRSSSSKSSSKSCSLDVSLKGRIRQLQAQGVRDAEASHGGSLCLQMEGPKLRHCPSPCPSTSHPPGKGSRHELELLCRGLRPGILVCTN